MEIRHSTEQDIPAMLKIYEKARAFMAENGNPNQWGPTNWPPEALLHEDIASGRSYICEENGVIGATFVYVYGKDIEPTYLNIEDGAWGKDEPYGVIHRIAASGAIKGAATFCINWAYEKCGYMRIDTHTDNIVMQNLLTKLGFRKTGIIHVVEDNYPRIAFEK